MFRVFFPLHTHTFWVDALYELSFGLVFHASSLTASEVSSKLLNYCSDITPKHEYVSSSDLETYRDRNIELFVTCVETSSKAENCMRLILLT